jgi:hypothetical protein
MGACGGRNSAWRRSAGVRNHGGLVASGSCRGIIPSRVMRNVGTWPAGRADPTGASPAHTSTAHSSMSPPLAIVLGAGKEPQPPIGAVHQGNPSSWNRRTVKLAAGSIIEPEKVEAIQPNLEEKPGGWASIAMMRSPSQAPAARENVSREGGEAYLHLETRRPIAGIQAHQGFASVSRQEQVASHAEPPEIQIHPPLGTRPPGRCRGVGDQRARSAIPQ